MIEILVVILLSISLIAILKYFWTISLNAKLAVHAKQASVIVLCVTENIDGLHFNKIDEVWKGEDYLKYISKNGYIGDGEKHSPMMKFGKISIRFIRLKEVEDTFEIGLGSNAYYEHKGKFQILFDGKLRWISYAMLKRVVKNAVA